ncbi:MAG: tRNA pseudouridine(55) synthase TruB [Anaerolineae bacterium]|nr:tRNA pseudouridine(55) synthase TruB [Anaerolineae bacterium]
MAAGAFGILNVDKPGGLTSHDVVARVRRGAGIRRVGHAGTLDPLATGVLVVCMGQATRLTEYLVDSMKVYRARVVLGVTTDTYDAEGATVAVRPVDVDCAAVEAALDAFRGEVEQAPPMYSAVKHQGTPLYRLARQGKEIEREPRWVNIASLALSEWEPPAFTLEVTCSAGTYVRTLAHDLGQALGTGAHLAGLRRLASGQFRVEDAVSLETLQAAFEAGSWRDYLLPADLALKDKPAVRLDGESAKRITNGRDVPAPLGASGLARAYTPDGRFVAVMQADLGAGVWHPIKVFNT